MVWSARAKGCSIRTLLLHQKCADCYSCADIDAALFIFIL